MAAVGVIGSGTWGTALSILLAGNGHQVTLWSALENEVKALDEDMLILDVDRDILAICEK